MSSVLESLREAANFLDALGYVLLQAVILGRIFALPESSMGRCVVSACGLRAFPSHASPVLTNLPVFMLQ